MAFDFETVFSSIADFFGSGYVFIIFGILVTLSVVKKLLKLMLIAIFIGVVWAACNAMTGGFLVDEIMKEISSAQIIFNL